MDWQIQWRETNDCPCTPLPLFTTIAVPVQQNITSALGSYNITCDINDQKEESSDISLLFLFLFLFLFDDRFFLRLLPL